MGVHFGEIFKQCDALQSPHVLAWTWVISPAPDLMELVPENQRRALMYDLTDRIVEDYYIERGLEPALAREVAEQLTERDALAAHSRDELSITAMTTARPLQAAIASAATFSVGAALPLLVVLASAPGSLMVSVGLASLIFLTLLGILGAKGGGAPVGKAVVRVVFWGALAMAVTAGVGAIFGATA